MSAQAACGRRRWFAGALLFAFGMLGFAGLGFAGPSQLPRPSNPPPPLQEIARWASDYRRLGARLDPRSDAGLAPALASLQLRFATPDEFENDALLALCDLASVAGLGSESALAQGRYVADPRESAVRDAARRVLRSALDAPVGEARGQWLATKVMAGADASLLGRRIAVAEALIGRHWDSTLLALFSAATSPERGLREACVKALSGWRSDAVDTYLARFTLRALREPGFLGTRAMFEHFSARALSPESPAAIEVARALSGSLVSADWREAVRCLPFTRALHKDLAVPRLIEALSLWKARGEAGASSRRVEAVIVDELEKRSGMRLGMSAERWCTWWKSDRARVSEPQGDNANQSAQRRTEAAFFGLRPWTDRVVFVIDRSGSMADPFGTERGFSRYTEALRELAVFLEQLGPRTHFNVILFSDEPRSWSDSLKPATPAFIDAALRWARNAPPQGGTMLQPAVERALAIDPRTRMPVLAKLEADTVIVLCDGATAEGQGWVAPLMSAVRDESCVRFDCVQIGNQGNGTLETLAEESGGEFVRVNS